MARLLLRDSSFVAKRVGLADGVSEWRSTFLPVTGLPVAIWVCCLRLVIQVLVTAGYRSPFDWRTLPPVNSAAIECTSHNKAIARNKRQ